MKRRSLVRFMKRSLWIILPFIGTIFLLDSCIQFRASNKQLQKQFKKLDHTLRIRTYVVDKLELRYLEVGEDTSRLVIFIHGAPGSNKDFIAYLKDTNLVKKARMISIDRPGYGYSGFGKSVVSIEDQARYIAPLLDLNKHSKPPILVGHSYGGPVVARIAMDYPKQASGPLLMLAPAIDPDNEKMFWVNKPFNSVVLRWMLPRAFRVSNDEKMAHATELEKMRPLWEKLENRTLFMHGYTDKIVTISNSQYGARMMINASVDTLFPQKMNHMFIWNKYDQVKAELFKVLKEEE